MSHYQFLNLLISFSWVWDVGKILKDNHIPTSLRKQRHPWRGSLCIPLCPDCGKGEDHVLLNTSKSASICHISQKSSARACVFCHYIQESPRDRAVRNQSSFIRMLMKEQVLRSSTAPLLLFMTQLSGFEGCASQADYVLVRFYYLIFH